MSRIAMSNIKSTIIVAGLLVIAIVSIVLLAVRTQDGHQRACEQRGGVFLSGRDGYLCLNPGAIVSITGSPAPVAESGHPHTLTPQQAEDLRRQGELKP